MSGTALDHELTPMVAFRLVRGRVAAASPAVSHAHSNGKVSHMATFITIGYGDQAGYEETDPSCDKRPTPTTLAWSLLVP